MREKELAILVSAKKYRDYDPQEELKQLAKTAGAEIVDCIRFDFLSPTPNLFIGTTGSADTNKEIIRIRNNLIIFMGPPRK